jgi:SpoVK/Ycf46/Vps4 family AAA+-type ATPase
MMGKYVGETEQLTKAAFDTINTISESIVFIDEVEKGLSGVTTDSSGVSIRQGGNFLKWMQDKSSDTYVIATANNIEALPSEYLRAGRWDAIFFIDMPDKSTKEKILELYKNKYNITDTIDVGKLPYTGAEIEVLCRLASTLSVSLVEASKFVCPISITNKQQIDKLRNFAKTRAVNAANYEIISSKIKM